MNQANTRAAACLSHLRTTAACLAISHCLGMKFTSIRDAFVDWVARQDEADDHTNDTLVNKRGS